MMIESSQLKSIDNYSKTFINQGIYFLYTIDHDKAKYLLKANNEFFLLDNNGNIIEKENHFEQSIIKESVYFSDIDLPPTANSIKIA